MINGVFAVYDTKAQAYLPPFYELNVDTAQRVVQLTIKTNTDSMMSKYPEDFILFDLGTFNNEDGEFDSYTPRSVCNLIHLVTDQETA